MAVAVTLLFALAQQDPDAGMPEGDARVLHVAVAVTLFLMTTYIVSALRRTRGKGTGLRGGGDDHRRHGP